MIIHIRKFQDRSIIIKECIIAVVALETVRIIASVLIVLGVVIIPGSLGNPDMRSNKTSQFSHRIVISSSLNNWTYVGQLVFARLGGATRRSGKVLLFVSKKINKGYGCDFADMKTSPRRMKEFTYETPYSNDPLPIEIYTYKSVAVLPDLILGTENTYGYTSLKEKPMIPYGSTHPDLTVLDDMQGLISPIQAQEVSKLVSGMSSDQIVTRLKHDVTFKQQIKNAAGADMWKAIQSNEAFYNK